MDASGLVAMGNTSSCFAEVIAIAETTHPKKIKDMYTYPFFGGRGGGVVFIQYIYIYIFNYEKPLYVLLMNVNILPIIVVPLELVVQIK